jgi:hypothetical protein
LQASLNDIPLEKEGPDVGDGEPPTAQITKNRDAGLAAEQQLQARFPDAKPQETLDTPYGKRRLDLLTPDGRGFESKVGRTSWTSFVKSQVKKDGSLLEDPANDVHSIHWVFSRSSVAGKIGPTPKLAEALEDAHITWEEVP